MKEIMSKGLVPLKEIVNEACGHTAFLGDIQIIERANIIEEELKALDVTRLFIKLIKLTFHFEDNDKIIAIFHEGKFVGTYSCATQKEYDLLKEELL